MPFPASVDIGSNSYPSYNSIEDSDIYIAADPAASEIWAALSDDVKGRHSVGASRVLNALSWLGTPTEADQELAWPRTGTGLSGVDDDEIPQAICDGHNELVIASVLGTDIANFVTTASNQKRIKAGSVEVENFRMIVPTYPLPQASWLLIAGYLQSQANVGARSTGTCGESILDRPFKHSVGI
jgi:Putative DnaT-like ssDNA binding protein